MLALLLGNAKVTAHQHMPAYCTNSIDDDASFAHNMSRPMSLRGICVCVLKKQWSCFGYKEPMTCVLRHVLFWAHSLFNGHWHSTVVFEKNDLRALRSSLITFAGPKPVVPNLSWGPGRPYKKYLYNSNIYSLCQKSAGTPYGYQGTPTGIPAPRSGTAVLNKVREEVFP